MKCRYCPVEFSPTNNRQRTCSPQCRRENQKQLYKFSARKTNIKYKYGISWEEWLDLYNEQDGRCPICFKFCEIHPKRKGEGLAVDHCHKTGAIRSLLCIPCNSAIGQLKEDPLIMQNAINYVLKFSKRERKKK